MRGVDPRDQDRRAESGGLAVLLAIGLIGCVASVAGLAKTLL